MSFMGVLLILLIVILALATFIESAYDTSTAWAVVYGTRWFEVLMILIAANIVGVMIRYRFFSRKKLVVLVFHLAFLMILLGAAITRFISYEGTMHIREKAISNTMLSDNGYMSVVLEANGDSVVHQKEVMITELTPRDYRMLTRVGGEKVRIRSTGYMSDAVEQYVAAPDGDPYLQLVIVGERQATIGLPSGDLRTVMGMEISFNSDDTTAILRFVSEGDELYVLAPFPVTSMQMGATGGMEYPALEPVLVNEGVLYAFGHMRMALQDYMPSARKRLVKAPAGERGSHLSAVRLEIKYRGMTSELYVPGLPRLSGKPVSGSMGDLAYSVTYGSKEIAVPFSLFLKDFEVERYPGSNSPSSFASEVVLVDKELGIQEDRRIFMNNVLKHRGYRFYQSSYDNDELGTVLSVNKDWAGTFVTYLGYILLIGGMVLALFIKGTRFSVIAKNTSSAAKKTVLLLLLFGIGIPVFAQEVPPRDVAREFGTLWVQDKGGRFKPMNTLSNEVVRKVTRKNRYEDYTSDQVMLGMMLYPDLWQDKPLFKVKHPEIHEVIGYKGELVSFNDLMDSTGRSYLLSAMVNEAFGKMVAAQTDLDKEVIKIDDRINAMFLVQSGGLLTIFPDEESENHKWTSVSEALSGHMTQEGDSVGMVFLKYLNAVRSGDYATAGAHLSFLKEIQDNKESLIPPETRKNLEIVYNNIRIFPRLARFYGLFGVLMMIFQFLIVFRPRKLYSWLFRVGVIHLVVAWVIHTLVLVARWYIGGHAPMSNGYESMIFVSWVTLLAGLIFIKRSGYAIALTAILSALSLMVAGMSNMNPEITNLVPVLKSPWLTIHVAVIMAGYGFLGLASIMGLMNVVMYAGLNHSNKERLGEVIQQVTQVNHLTLIVGLYFMTAGVFLGGVWANESWGRYWGWDPKETWALITVLVYAFVTHMHRIPGMRGTFAFNLASFVAYSSVMMTYFGVNYFLGGIHSYAGGSAFKVPVAVYVTITLLIVLCIFAYRRQMKVLPDSVEQEGNQ